MTSSIKISKSVKTILDKMKGNGSYDDLIFRLVEDELELNEKSKKELQKSRKGKSVPHHEVKKRFGI